MSEEANKLALDLEELIPAEHRVGIGIGDAVADVLAIVAAVKAQDWKAAGLAIAKLINDLLGPAPVAAHPAVNWQNVWNIIGKLLPIIGGFI
jgi:hypothetical protein